MRKIGDPGITQLLSSSALVLEQSRILFSVLIGWNKFVWPVEKKNQQRNDPCGGTAIKTIAESKLEKNSCLGKVWTHMPGSEASFGGFSWFKESDQITLWERQTL